MSLTYDIQVHTLLTSPHISSFDDPDKSERKLYSQYWQKKLKSNKSVDFSDSLVDEIAETTDKFSFAYLKEVL